eukprot:NODE_141_length_2380_cov_41.749035_g97_i0.p1 GENE.NODE_141_length_2380_cov_41.749035_g97_i0~~NODE_141_length_2380_cov_41.749035_g97_i0.p1  ORF type:complete len:370 (+),score=66.85 NODE_141_length_2380_cov_41.749035_g97_i0:58-1110(+)
MNRIFWLVFLATAAASAPVGNTSFECRGRSDVSFECQNGNCAVTTDDMACHSSQCSFRSDAACNTTSLHCQNVACKCPTSPFCPSAWSLACEHNDCTLRFPGRTSQDFTLACVFPTIDRINHSITTTATAPMTLLATLDLRGLPGAHLSVMVDTPTPPSPQFSGILVRGLPSLVGGQLLAAAAKSVPSMACQLAKLNQYSSSYLVDSTQVHHVDFSDTLTPYTCWGPARIVSVFFVDCNPGHNKTNLSVTITTNRAAQIHLPLVFDPPTSDHGPDFFWRVQGPRGPPSYLLGTVHTPYPFVQAVADRLNLDQLIADVSYVYGELDMTDTAIQKKLVACFKPPTTWLDSAL